MSHATLNFGVLTGDVNIFVFGVSTCIHVYVVVKYLFQVIFLFLLFLGMVIYANKVETKEK